MRRRPMSRTDRLLFMQLLDQARTFAQVCEEGELHASRLAPRLRGIADLGRHGDDRTRRMAREVAGGKIAMRIPRLSDVSRSLPLVDASYQLWDVWPREVSKMTKIALFGAGGKMGMRLGANLKNSAYSVAPVEVSDAGKKRLKDELGWEPVDADTALAGAEIVVLAVPDTAIGKVSHGIVDKLKPGTMVVILDAAAPYAGHLPKRDDITYFVTHPCHPPIFNDETEMKAKLDRFGGVAAKQAIVCCLMQGPESDYRRGEDVAKTIWAPVMRSHRLTVEQLALLEPGPGGDGRRLIARCDARSHGRGRQEGRAAGGGPRFPARSHEYPWRGDLQGAAGRVLGCLQQGDPVRKAGVDARRLEARLRRR